MSHLNRKKNKNKNKTKRGGGGGGEKKKKKREEKKNEKKNEWKNKNKKDITQAFMNNLERACMSTCSDKNGGQVKQHASLGNKFTSRV